MSENSLERQQQPQSDEEQSTTPKTQTAKQLRNSDVFDQETQAALIKAIADSETTTEFLMGTLQLALGFEASQVNEILTSSNQFLFQACESGIKGDFQPIITWFELLISQLPKLIQLFRVAYAKNKVLEVSLVLTSIRLGFFSQNETVAKLAIDTLDRVANMLYIANYEYGLSVKKHGGRKASLVEVKVPIFKHFQEWFVEPKKQLQGKRLQQSSVVVGDFNSMLRIMTVETLENHPYLTEQMAKLILAVFRTPDESSQPTLSLVNLPEKLAEVFSDDIFLSYSALSLLIPEIRKLDRGALQNLILNSRLVYSFLIRGSEQEADQAIRLLCTKLLIDVWHYEYANIVVMAPTSTNGPVKDYFFEVLKAGLAHKDKVYRIAVFSGAFSLVDKMITDRSNESPGLLKVLIQALVDQMRLRRKERITEEFCLRNFLALFEKHDDIPVQVVVDQVIQIFRERIRGDRKQGGNSQKPGNLSTEELNFLIEASKHKKLTANSAFLVLEVLATIYISKPAVALTLLPTIIAIISKFQRSPKIINFVESILITKALSMVLQLKKDEQIQQSQSPYLKNNQPLALMQGGSTSSAKVLPRGKITGQDHLRLKHETTLKLQRYQMVHLLEQCLELEIPQFRQMIQDQIKPLAERYIAVFKQNSSAYEHLIRRFDLQVKPVLALTMEQNQVVAVADQDLSKQQEELEKKKMQQKRALLWSAAKEPKSDIALRAIEEMNELKQQRIKRQNEERIAELKKKERFDKIAEKASQEVQMSRLIIEKQNLQRKQNIREKLASDANVTSKNTTSLQYDQTNQNVADEFSPFDEFILDSPFNSNKRALTQQDRRTKLQSSLVNFELDEEERERDAMRLFVYKNRDLFIFLFKKYTAMGTLNLKRGSAEITQKRLITLNEITRFFQEINQETTQKDFIQLIKAINEFFLVGHGTSALEFKGFVQLIIQAAIQQHRNGKIIGISQWDAQRMLYSEMVHSFMLQWYKQSTKRGEKPAQIIGVGDKDEQGNYFLFQEQIPSAMRQVLGQSKCAALEILDYLISEQFGFSIFEKQAQLEISYGQNKDSSRAKSRIEPQHRFQLYSDRYSDRDYQPQTMPQKVSSQELVAKNVDFSIYQADSLILALGLKQDQQRRRVFRKDKENEQILMGLKLSPALKLACYELQQVHPQSQLDFYRDIALTVEDMLTSVTQNTKYPPTLQGEHSRSPQKKRTLAKAHSLVNDQSLPKLPKLKDVLTEEHKQQQEQRQQKDIEYLKRGVLLKDELRKQRELKEQKEQEKLRQQEEEKLNEIVKYQRYQERIKKQKEVLVKQRIEKEQVKQEELRFNKLRKDVAEMLKYSDQKVREQCTAVFMALRQQYVQVKFTHEQIHYDYVQETVQVVEVYRDNTQVNEIFLDAQQTLIRVFQHLLVFQNTASRTQGQPKHLGLNLDGVLNFFLRVKLVPHQLNLQDVAVLVKKIVVSRSVLPDAIGANSRPVISTDHQLLQKVNFMAEGGHLNFEEFQLLITRVVGLSEVDFSKQKQNQGQVSELDEPIQRMKMEAKELGLESELQRELSLIIKNWHRVRLYSRVLAEQRSQSQASQLLFNPDNVEKFLQQLMQEFLPALSDNPDMSLPIMPMSIMGSMDFRESPLIHQRNLSAASNKQKLQPNTTKQKPNRIRQQVNEPLTAKKVNNRSKTLFQSQRGSLQLSQNQLSKPNLDLLLESQGQVQMTSDDQYAAYGI